jgi:hypothetical protein
MEHGYTVGVKNGAFHVHAVVEASSLFLPFVQLTLFRDRRGSIPASAASCLGQVFALTGNCPRSQTRRGSQKPLETRRMTEKQMRD